MITAWEWVKAHAEYVYASIIFGLAAMSFAQGDTAAGWFNIAIGSLLFALMKLLKPRPSGGKLPPPRTFEEGELVLLSKGGLEPVPIPGEAHDALNCPICKQFQDRWERPL